MKNTQMEGTTNSSRVAMIAALSVGIAMWATGCTSIAWQRAQRVNTIDEYRKFATEYPAAQKASEARKRADDLAYRAANNAQTIDAWQDYIRANPSGLHLAEATKQVTKMDDDAFMAARNGGDVADLEAFLKIFPSSRHAAEARSLVERIKSIEAELKPIVASLKEGMSMGGVIKLLGTPDNKALSVTEMGVSGISCDWYRCRDEGPYVGHIRILTDQSGSVVKEVASGIGVKQQ